MNHNNTNKAIVAFVVLSVIAHGIIAYVIIKTNDSEQNLEPIEIVDQNELNQKPEYKKPPAPKKRITQKKPRVKTPRIETPPVTASRVETPTVETETPRVETPRVETSSVEEGYVKKEVSQEAGKLSALPENPPLRVESSGKESLEKEAESVESVTASDEKSDIVVDAGDPSGASKSVVSGEVGSIAENENGAKAEASSDGSRASVSGGVKGSITKNESVTETAGASSGGSDGSDSVAIQELKKVTGIAEKSKNKGQTGGASKEALSSSENSELSKQASIKGKSVQTPPISKSSAKLKKKYGPTYRVDQVTVIKPTSFKYPQTSRRLKEEGTAILRVFFDKSGQPQKVELIKSTGSSRLDSAARQGVRTLRIKPLGYAFIYELPVRFQLDFTDQQLNQSFDFLAPNEGLGKFKTKAQSGDL